MADQSAQQATTQPPSVTATTRPNTRSHAARQAAENESIEDSEHQGRDNARRRGKDKDKEKEKFRGESEKMHGHVFQLYSESKKANQFTTTLEALQRYATVEFEHHMDLAPFFADPISEPNIPEPSDTPPPGSDGVTPVPRESRKYITWKFECESYDTRKQALDTNKSKLFTVILSQCSESIKPKLESTTGYAAARTKNDCKWLLTTLKDICHRFEQSDNRFVALVKAKGAIFNCKQQPTQSTMDYYETFKELLSVLESYGGKLHDPPKAAPATSQATLTAMSSGTDKDAYMREHYAAALFILNADKQRFGQLKSDLANNNSLGRDEYPASLSAAYQLLLTYRANSTAEDSATRRDPG
jgi:hypothetical protein